MKNTALKTKILKMQRFLSYVFYYGYCNVTKQICRLYRTVLNWRCKNTNKIMSGKIAIVPLLLHPSCCTPLVNYAMQKPPWIQNIVHNFLKGQCNEIFDYYFVLLKNSRPGLHMNRQKRFSQLFRFCADIRSQIFLYVSKKMFKNLVTLSL